MCGLLLLFFCLLFFRCVICRRTQGHHGSNYAMIKTSEGELVHYLCYKKAVGEAEAAQPLPDAGIQAVPSVVPSVVSVGCFIGQSVVRFDGRYVLYVVHFVDSSFFFDGRCVRRSFRWSLRLSLRWALRASLRWALRTSFISMVVSMVVTSVVPSVLHRLSRLLF